MNKILCIILSLALLLTGCASPTSKQEDEVIVLPDTKVEFNEIFTVDLCHPNDCGFATMAMAVTKGLKELGV